MADYLVNLTFALFLIFSLPAIIIYLFINWPKTENPLANTKWSKPEREQLLPMVDQIEFRENLTPMFGYVYFVRDPVDGSIKIGKTINPEKRLRNQFGTKMARDLQKVVVYETAEHHRTEKLLHAYYRHKRGNGEWFYLNERDIEEILNCSFPEEIARDILSEYDLKPIPGIENFSPKREQTNKNSHLL